MAPPVQGSEREDSFAWARQHLHLEARGGEFAAVIKASAVLPLSPRDSYQVLSHPDNAAAFRGIERCTFRKVLWASGDTGHTDGRQTVEVENESDWQFLFFKGSIRTRMIVQEDPTALTIHIRLAPAGGNAPLQHMTGKWRFEPGPTPTSSQVTLEQEVHPRGLHPILFNGFRKVAAMQVRKTFEDLYAEALRMNAGRPTLPPYSQVAHKEIRLVDDADSACCSADEADPASVLAAAYELESTTSTTSVSCQQRSPRSATHSSRRLSGSSNNISGGLRSHPIGSLLDLACLDGVTGADLAAEAEAARQAAARDAAALEAEAAAPAAPLTWRASLYSVLQKVWVVSNAALGMAPNAVAELEEMAVFV